MQIRHYLWLSLLVVLSFAVVSCEDSGKRKTTTAPPPQAQAPTIAPVPAKPAAEPKVEAVVRTPDEVDALILRVETAYNAGQANYSAGHLDAAKRNFDEAVDLLLQGPTDVASDERLQREFDKIIEGVHTLELRAVKEGDGFTEQKAEPAPIDEANEVTFPVDPNIKAKAAEELKETHSDLPLVLNDAVASYINFFSNRGRGTLESALARSGRYREMIQRVLKEEGVPQDLIYLAQAESGFHPFALSRAGARGMWQFMASRATSYGLDRNWWVDERQDPEKATRAAARHLKDLHTQFGDWYLAMAAYNSGPGTVQAAVQRTGYADFWELYKRGVLPQETRNYVPIILAVTIMAKNPQQYGLDHVELEKPAPAEVVRIDYPVDLRLVAECVDSSVEALQDLNPSLLRMTTPKDEPFDLHIPAGTRDKFTTAMAAIPLDKRVLWRYEKVGPGETLSTIAKKYHTTVQAIRQANNLDSDAVSTDAKLIIPVTSAKANDASQVSAYSRKVTYYRVRKGDTILSVADDFGVPADKIRTWNHLRGNALR
ncbi:MAG: transglycosylase SLT domain-containing protein, partial [Acidobacteriaceae bacterium]|nr:transglycosylase SLT domain-containing protein [Acidobacteriaceae bacterium]